MMKVAAALTVLGILAVSTPSMARMIAPSPISQRVARADAVVVGKVVALAEKAEKADMFEGDGRQMLIATVRVEESISGKKAKTVKVAYFAPGGGPGIRPNIVRGGVRLTKDQEGMMFLTKHPKKKGVYVVQAYFDVVAKDGNENFVAERGEARRCAKLLKDYKIGLDSKDATARFETAMLLVTRYRAMSGGVDKTEAVPAGESKKILLALAGADWKYANSRSGATSPMSTFYLLGLQPGDGWTAPNDRTQLQAEAKKWLEANAGKYNMKRFVRAVERDDTEPDTE